MFGISSEWLTKAKRKASGYLYQSRVVAHNLLPIIEHPSAKLALSHYREGLSKENANTYPLPTDEANLQCVWSIEFYTPSSITSLRRGLEKLGLARDPIFPDRHPEKWLSSLREGNPAVGSRSLGFLFRKGERRIFASGKVGPLPEFAEFAALDLINISPSITALIVRYTLRPAWRSKFFDAVAQDYGLKFKAFGMAHSVHGPRELKRQAVEDARQDIRQQTHGWFNQHLPGVLSSSELSRLPVCELLFINPPDAASSRSPLEELLGLGPEYFQFETADLPGIRFQTSLRRGLEETYTGVLTAHRREIQAIDLGGYGDDDGSYANRIGRCVETFLSIWGLMSLLSEIEARLSRVRDAELGVSSGNAETVLKRLRAMTIESADVSSIAEDLTRSELRWMVRQAIQFTRKAQASDAEDFNLTKALVSRVVDRAKLLGKFDMGLKALAMQSGNLLVASTNLKLQRSVWVFTIIALVAAIVSAIKPIQELWTQTESARIATIQALKAW